ncbi:hypothetical protein H4R33_003593 [Dimargaris cristalligena]|nr:hypothetical protein H4R33_003593 [Dimargaris cristalligena]
MRLGEIIYPLLATHFTAFNSPLNPTKQSPNASEAKWVKQFLALPDLVRNPAADVIVKQLSLSAYVWWAPALLNTSPKDLPLLNEKTNLHPDKIVGLNIGNPLFTRANWKYVNLAKIGLLEFTRHFPLAQAATANLLGLIVTLKPAKDLDTNIIWETRVALNQSDFEVYIGDQVKLQLDLKLTYPRSASTFLCNDHAKFERTMRLGAL